MKKRERLIRNFCRDNGIEIRRGVCFQYDHETSTISERQPCGEDTWIYSMLHELGHALLMRADNYPDNIRLTNAAGFTGNHFPHDRRTPARMLTDRDNNAAPVFILTEEILAWELGYRLAVRGMEFGGLGMTIDAIEYERCAEACILGYVIELSKSKRKPRNLRKNADI